MKLSTVQLRRLISEVIAEVSRPAKIVLGGVYYNNKHQQIHVVFVGDDDVGFEMLSNGRVMPDDYATKEQFTKMLVAGKFELDHVEKTW